MAREISCFPAAPFSAISVVLNSFIWLFRGLSTFVPFILRGTKESRGKPLKKPNVQSGRVSFITVKVHKADTDISYLYRISKGVMLLGSESEDGATNEP